MEIRYAVGTCNLGKVLVANTGEGICAVLLGDSDQELVDELGKKFSKDSLKADDHGLGDLLAWIVAFVDSVGRVSDSGLKLDVRGTEFQQRVWVALREIPAGETRTYSEIAEAMGAPKSVRAVASACGANKLAVVIPCHRVVAKNGGLAGYRWGVERKRALLEQERDVRAEDL